MLEHWLRIHNKKNNIINELNNIIFFKKLIIYVFSVLNIYNLKKILFFNLLNNIQLFLIS